MQIDLTFLSIIDILSISTSFMLGLLFLTVKSSNKIANIFLGLFLWSLSTEVFNAFFQNYTEEFTLILQTTLFTIPFLLIYVNQTINNKFEKWFLLLFIPGILYNGVFFFNYEEDSFIAFEYLFNISLLFYTLKVLRQHKNNVNNYYSDIEHKTLSWIKAIIFIYLGFHVFWIIEDIVGFQNENYVEYFASISTIATFFMIYWIGYNGFSQSEIFKQRLFLNSIKKEAKEGVVSSVSDDSKQAFEKLKHQIELQKLYTNTDLNLRSLSEALQIKEKELSKLINKHSKANFYQFINGFRVSEFKILMQSPKAQQLSILGLAEEAGFSSKSTFYSTFKSLEGLTPKQYELSLNKSE